jgi:hypothetical protein
VVGFNFCAVAGSTIAEPTSQQKIVAAWREFVDMIILGTSMKTAYYVS